MSLKDKSGNTFVVWVKVVATVSSIVVGTLLVSCANLDKDDSSNILPIEETSVLTRPYIASTPVSIEELRIAKSDSPGSKYFMDNLHKPYFCITNEIFGSAMQEVLLLADDERVPAIARASRAEHAANADGSYTHSGGTIVLSAPYLLDFEREFGREARILPLIVVLHELAHIRQFYRVETQWQSELASLFELHADFMAGWMIGYLTWSNCYTPDPPNLLSVDSVRPATLTYMWFGHENENRISLALREGYPLQASQNDSHGNSVERGAMVWLGYEYAIFQRNPPKPVYFGPDPESSDDNYDFDPSMPILLTNSMQKYIGAEAYATALIFGKNRSNYHSAIKNYIAYMGVGGGIPDYLPQPYPPLDITEEGSNIEQLNRYYADYLPIAVQSNQLTHPRCFFSVNSTTPRTEDEFLQCFFAP